jgi:colicin import membrane protein
MSRKEAEVKQVVTTIAEYSQTAAALATLKAELEGKLYEVGNATGLALAKFHRRELVTLRTDLEKKRKEIKAPALARCKEIDTEAARITAELLLLEKPIDDQIKVEEARKEEIAAEKRRQEEARVSQIRERIQKLNNIPLMAAGMASADLELFIARVEAQQIGTDFAEYQQEAIEAKAEVIGKLKEALDATLAKEEELAKEKLRQEEEAQRLEALRIEQEKEAAAERERLAAEKAEQDRLNAIEQEKIAAERAELEKLRAADRKRQEESDRVASEKQAELEAERESLRKEQEELNRKESARMEKEQAEQAERDRLAREKAEKETEEKRQAELKQAQEKHEAELAKRTSNHKTTLESILAAAEDQTLSAPAALQMIVMLAKRGLGRKA